MFDIISLIIISIFVPVVVFTGIKIYETKSLNKLIKALTIVLLGLELVRFFYNASLYPNGVTPSNSLTFSNITLLCICSLFATFNKEKIGEISKSIFCLTIFIPIILALFDNNVFSFTYDTYAVIKALYFLECGFALTLAILYVKENHLVFKKEILYAICYFVIYVVINVLCNEYWNIGTEYNSNYYLKMIISLFSTGVVLGLTNLVYIKNKNE